MFSTNAMKRKSNAYMGPLKTQLFVHTRSEVSDAEVFEGEWRKSSSANVQIQNDLYCKRKSTSYIWIYWNPFLGPKHGSTTSWFVGTFKAYRGVLHCRPQDALTARARKTHARLTQVPGRDTSFGALGGRLGMDSNGHLLNRWTRKAMRV